MWPAILCNLRFGGEEDVGFSLGGDKECEGLLFVLLEVGDMISFYTIVPCRSFWRGFRLARIWDWTGLTPRNAMGDRMLLTLAASWELC